MHRHRSCDRPAKAEEHDKNVRGEWRMRLDRYLSEMGFGTRSEIKKIIKSGNVQVDDRPVSDPGMHVTAESRVVCDGYPVVYEACVYYMMNKPAGVVSATEDPCEKTVLDLITEQKRRGLFPVGRLDKDTEGLLLITNDGALEHRLLTPGKHVDKTYYARVAGVVTAEDVEKFAQGLKVDDDFTALPARLEIYGVAERDGLQHADAAGQDRMDHMRVREQGAVSEVMITIHEGKYHQIKRMVHAVGKEVLYLKRISMGSLVLDPDLAPGEYRRLTKEELICLKCE